MMSPETNSAFTLRRQRCGQRHFRVELGQAGVGNAAWCLQRAKNRGRRDARLPLLSQAYEGPSLESLSQDYGRLMLRQRPEWVWLSPSEDPFLPGVSPVQRRTALEVASLFLARQVGIYVSTRGSLAEAEGLVALARAHGALLKVRVGVFSLNRKLEEKWEPGMPASAERLRLARALREAGAEVQVEIGPVIPFANDEDRELMALVRAVGRVGVREIVPRWIEGGPGLAAQLEEEISPSTARLVTGWLRQPGGREGGGRSLPSGVRAPRLEAIRRAAMMGKVSLPTCACMERGASEVCPSPPALALPKKERQLNLFALDSGSLVAS